ncbi:MAG: ATP-binding protein [Deltaproteobacteria bacterium]|nr:ATP-binding protein [Deltaproteobacteria bacterium]
MKRLIESELYNWGKDFRRKPLILRGARQVGKTFTVKKFGAEVFAGDFVPVDLEKHPEWHPIFEKNLDAKRILSELELVCQKKITPGRTLLFLDEIQSAPRALMALRYFYENLPELHVIAAGSLLEFALKEISFPVGRVQFLELFPMNFAEFLWATGKEPLADLVLSPIPDDPKKAPSETIHRLLLDETRKYLFVGGMPEAVRVYAETESFKEGFAVHAELVNAYRADFAKYTPRVDKQCLESVFRGAAKNAGRQIKYSRLAEGHSNPTLKRAFDVLCQARLVQKIESASPAGLPLGALDHAGRFKALLLDLGLIHHFCGLPVEALATEKDLLSVYEGALAEQFVGQELRSVLGNELFYWSRAEKSSSAEVDYLFTKKGKIYPVEVKSGPAGRLKSMHLLLEKYPNCPEGFVVSEAPPAELPEKRLRFIPLYYAYSLGA